MVLINCCSFNLSTHTYNIVYNLEWVCMAIHFLRSSSSLTRPMVSSETVCFQVSKWGIRFQRYNITSLVTNYKVWRGDADNWTRKLASVFVDNVVQIEQGAGDVNDLHQPTVPEFLLDIADYLEAASSSGIECIARPLPCCWH